MHRASACERIAALSFAAFAANSAFGAGQRSFVASNGVDNPSCSLASPCRSFGAAVTATDADGEVIVLDSAGYGTVSITKSISIIAPPGIYAGITVSGPNDGVRVNGFGINVRLKGLAINGQTGQTGIRFVQGASLTVEGCTVTNFASDGISIEFAGKVSISDTLVAGNAGNGLNINAPSTLAVARSRFERNVDGIAAGAGADVSILATTVVSNMQYGINATQNTVGTTRIVIESSVIADNVNGTGVLAWAQGASAAVHLQIARSTVARNLQGIYSFGLGGGIALVSAVDNQTVDHAGGSGLITGPAGSKLRASRNTVAGNQNGFYQASGGLLYTQGNNVVRDNAVDDGGHTADTPL